jgi:hypothetical protein
MMIEIGYEALDAIARAWLKDTLEALEINLNSDYVHPDDEKTYKKDIKAVKRLLDYVGEAV